jgi:hypothetical protein
LRSQIASMDIVNQIPKKRDRIACHKRTRTRRSSQNRDSVTKRFELWILN